MSSPFDGHLPGRVEYILMQPWKTIRRRTLCQPNKFLTVELHAVELPNGRVIDDWPWLITPDFATLLARDIQGRFLFFRQIKYAVDGMSLAPVGGFLEPGEDPLTGAQRELLEETGYAADSWISLGKFPVDANRGAGHAHLFVALNARPAGPPRETDLEEPELHFLTRDETEQALADGQFKALPWVAVVALGLRYLRKCGV